MDLSRLLGSTLDFEASLELFASIKHTRLEGLIVEHEVEQTLLVNAAARGWRPIRALVLRRLCVNNTKEFLIVCNQYGDDVRALVAKLRRTREQVRALRLSGAA